MKRTWVIRNHINKRSTNDDSYQATILTSSPDQDWITLLAVADGMGGHEHGADISYQTLLKLSLILAEDLAFTQTLNQIEVEIFTPVRIATALLNATQQTNAYIRRLIHTNHWEKAGTTLVASLIWKHYAIVVNVGDSPLYHYSITQHQLLQVTQNHSLAGLLLQSGLITEETEHYQVQRHFLEFYIGAEALPEPLPLKILNLSVGDLLLLCSDGISGTLFLSQIESLLTYVLQSTNDLNQAADQLVEAALLKGETDNQTLILWRYDL